MKNYNSLSVSITSDVMFLFGNDVLFGEYLVTTDRILLKQMIQYVQATAVTIEWGSGSNEVVIIALSAVIFLV